MIRDKSESSCFCWSRLCFNYEVIHELESVADVEQTLLSLVPNSSTTTWKVRQLELITSMNPVPLSHVEIC